MKILNYVVLLLFPLLLSAQGAEPMNDFEQAFWKKVKMNAEHPENVIRLDCRNVTKIDSLFSVLPRFKNLEWLNLWGLNLKSVPDIFDALSKLSWVDFGKNQLQALPPSFNRLLHLKTVGLYHNQFKELPSVLAKSNLIELRIDHNLLTGVLVCTDSWSELKTLNAGNNSFTGVTQIENLRSITRLVFSNNNLEKLPDSFNTCRQLKSIHLDRNPIAELPLSLLKLRRLNYVLIEQTGISDRTLYDYRARFPKVGFDSCSRC